MKCVFCKNDFDPSNNTDEHVLLNCLGGRLKTAKVDCSKCNNDFGIGIDNDMAKSVERIRCVGTLLSGDNQPPPPIKNVLIENGEKIELRPGMVPYKTKVEYKRNELSDGKTEIKMGVGSFEQLAALLPQFAKGVNLSPEKLLDVMTEKDIQIQQQHISEPIHLQFQFGGNSTRSMAKSLIVLWSHFFGNDDFLSECADNAVNFVLNEQFAKVNKDFSLLDSRQIPLSPQISSQQKFGEHYNLMTVFTDQDGHLYGVFRLYNFVSWIFDFKVTSNRKSSNVTLISNPLAISNWKSFIDDKDYTLDAIWIQNKRYNLEDVRKNTFAFIQTLEKKNEDKSVADMIHEILHNSLPAEGEIIEEKHINLLARNLAEEIVKKQLRLNGVKTVGGPKVASTLQDFLKKNQKKLKKKS